MSTEYASKRVFPKILNTCTPLKYTLLPVAKKLLGLVAAIFVHELNDKVNF